MERILEIFQIQAFVSVVEVDFLPQNDILLHFQLEELPHVNITSFNFTRGKRRYDIYKGIEFCARLECFSAFQVLPVYIFLSNLESQIICAAGFDLGPLVTDSYRRTFQGIEDVETYQVALQLLDRYDHNYGNIHVEFSVQHFSTDTNKIFCYEDLPNGEIADEPPEFDEYEPEPKKKVEKKVNKRKFPRVNPRAADLYLLNIKYMDTKIDLINQVRELENQVKRIETSRRRKVYKEKKAQKTMNDHATSEYSSSLYSASSTASKKKKPKIDDKSNNSQEFSSSSRKKKTDSQKARDSSASSKNQQSNQAQTQFPHFQPQIPLDKPQIQPIQTQTPVINSKQDQLLNSARSHSSHSSKSSKSSTKRVQDITDNVTQDLKDSLAKSKQSSSGQQSINQGSSKIESSTNSGMKVIDDVAANLSHSSHSSRKSNSSHISMSSHNSKISNSSKASKVSNNSITSNISKTSNNSKASKNSKASISSKKSKNSTISIGSKSGIENSNIISESFSSSSHTTNAETTTTATATTGKQDDSIGDISNLSPSNSTLGEILGSDNSEKPKNDDNDSKKSMSSILSKSEDSKISTKSNSNVKTETKNDKINLDSDLSSILKDINTNEASSLDSELKAELGLTSSNLTISDINLQSKKDTDKKSKSKTDTKEKEKTSSKKDNPEPEIEEEEEDKSKNSGSTNGTDILSILSD